MKKLKELEMAFIAIIACISMAACSNKIDVPVADDEQEVYTVKIGWSGEILDIKDEPLSRATTNDLYGIQVYSTPYKELEEGEKVEWIPYAYGLFDDPNAISLNLLKGYKYKFVATMVVNGKDIIYNYPKNSYDAPFCLSFGESVVNPLSKGFNYHSTAYMGNLAFGSSGIIKDEGYKRYEHPNTDRYYGELAEFKLGTVEAVSIPMKRVSFGATFVAVNSVAKEGTLEILMESAPKMEITFTEESNEFKTQDVFTFHGVAAAYAKDDYTETIPVTINWHRADGTTVPLGAHDIIYKRNRNTIVTVKITNTGSDSDLGFTIDESEQTGIEDMEKGDDVTIENGEVEESVVAVNKTVTLTTSGTLSTLITEEEKYKITSLTISGPLNNVDIDFINQMIKKGDFVQTGGEEGSLRSLDLKESTITTSMISLTSNILETLVLPNGLESVELHCSLLTSVNIPEGVIGLNLNGCSSLESINLPNGLLFAFLNHCEALESVNLPNGIEGVQMSYCSSLTSIDVPNGLEFIGNLYYYDTDPSNYIDLSNCTSLTTVTLANSVTEIGYAAFENCVSLKNISIPENLEIINNEAFSGCKALTNIELPNSITEIGTAAFEDCSSLSSISLPSSLSVLGDGAFIGCTKLSSITFNSNIAEIKAFTFGGCSSLTSITFPNGVRTIGNNALANCTSLESVTLPSSVTSLGEQLFYNCSKIKEIHCKATEPPTAKENTFLSVSSSCIIYVPENSSASYKQADYWKFFGDNIKEE